MHFSIEGCIFIVEKLVSQNTFPQGRRVARGGEASGCSASSVELRHLVDVHGVGVLRPEVVRDLGAGDRQHPRAALPRAQRCLDVLACARTM